MYQHAQTSPLSTVEEPWLASVAKGAVVSAPAFHAFPAFLLNAASIVKKQSLKAVVHPEDDDDDENDRDGGGIDESDTDEERKARSPPSQQAAAPPPPPSKVTVNHGSRSPPSMSIIDILSPIIEQPATTAARFEVSSVPIYRLGSIDSGYRSSVSGAALPVQPLLYRDDSGGLKRKARSSSPDPVDAKREKQRVVYRRCYYKKVSTLAQLRTLHQALENEYRDVLSRHHSQCGDHLDTLRCKYRDLCRTQADLRDEVERLHKSLLGTSKITDKLQWLVDAEILNHVDIGPVLPEETLAIEPLTAHECRAHTHRILSRWITEKSSPHQPSGGGDEVAFGWRMSSRPSCTTGTAPCAMRLFKIVSCSDDLSLATWRRCFSSGEHQLTAALFAGDSVTPVHRIDDDHLVVHVTSRAWQASLLCGRVILADKSQVITMQSIDGPSLSTPPPAAAAAAKRWLEEDALVAWLSFHRRKVKTPAPTTRRAGGAPQLAEIESVDGCEMEIHCGLHVRQPVASSSETRHLLVRLVTALRRWETLTHLAPAVHP